MGPLGTRFVIHTVGPYLDEEGRTQPSLLEACYVSVLRCAMQVGAKSIAFPSISTGFYGYPMEEATRLACATITKFFHENLNYEACVVLVAFGDIPSAIMRALLPGREKPLY